MMETPTMATAIPINANVLGAAMGLCGGEWSDDGNDSDDDARRNDCALQPARSGIAHIGEECDDGNRNDADACRNHCVAQPVVMVPFTSALSAVTMEL